MTPVSTAWASDAQARRSVIEAKSSQPAFPGQVTRRTYRRLLCYLPLVSLASRRRFRTLGGSRPRPPRSPASPLLGSPASRLADLRYVFLDGKYFYIVNGNISQTVAWEIFFTEIKYFLTDVGRETYFTSDGKYY